MNNRGLLITFEGGEGCGKSTQITLLTDALKSTGLGVIIVREPGGTLLGEGIRTLLLDPDSYGAVDIRAELLLYEASRAQLVTERIRPALATGEAVICDRFTDSTLAYQGFGRGLPLDEINSLNSMATGGLQPDLTIVLDLPVEVGLARATAQGADRLEAEELAFHERVRGGFLELADAQPDRMVVIDAAGSEREVHQSVMAAVERIPVLAMLLERSDG
ncbi:MAG: dTMP kinase [Actinomycetota bacterium]|nr:dTMP kinase [Actinomycetota bacterium]MDZ4178538.1 dTMP kinase [Coriobacteriia bacterium]